MALPVRMQAVAFLVIEVTARHVLQARRVGHCSLAPPLLLQQRIAPALCGAGRQTQVASQHVAGTQVQGQAVAAALHSQYRNMGGQSGAA